MGRRIKILRLGVVLAGLGALTLGIYWLGLVYINFWGPLSSREGVGTDIGWIWVTGIFFLGCLSFGLAFAGIIYFGLKSLAEWVVPDREA